MREVTEFQNQKILLLIKLDAKSLFSRIKHRRAAYVGTFSLKRTREHFPAIFENKYRYVQLQDLKYASEDVIFAIDKFYNKSDDIYWYLNHTEDMPTALEDKLDHDIREIEEYYNTLQLYIDAELGYSNDEK